MKPLPLTRRKASLLAATSLLAGCAGMSSSVQAQGEGSASVWPALLRAPDGVVLPVSLPCANRPGDLTGFLLEALGPSPAGTVVVLGQAFRPGDLPRAARLAARLADGRPVPAQLDVSVRHPDGSVRFGLVSLAIPALGRAGQRLGIILSAQPTEAADAAPPLELAAALAGRQAMVTLTPAGGGQPWQMDLLGPLRAAAPANDPLRTWQSGPLAVQRRVTVLVPSAAAGGVTSLRLIADVALHADGTLWVDLWLRNDTAMRPGGGTATYSLRVALDGREALRIDQVRHFQYQGWGRLLGSMAGGRPAPVPPLLRPDTAYLTEAGAVARYDLSTGVAERLLDAYARALADPGWALPLGARGVTQYMPMGGGRPDIGPTTQPQAAWLVSGDPRAATYALGQAEAAGSIPWHLWDPGAANGRGGWMDTRRWPGSFTLMQPGSEETGWTMDSAHQPDLAFVPYLLTGRRAFLDELQAQAASNIIGRWPPGRDDPAVTGVSAGVNVINAQQVRGAAWSMRQLDETAWISPDDDLHQGFFRHAAAANWAWLRSMIPTWTRLQGEAHGWVPGEYGDNRGVMAPWQQDYLASSVAMAARRGNDDALAVLAWMNNFLAGRFLAEDKGFVRHDGVAYNLASGPADGTRRTYRTWAEWGAATRSRGWSSGGSWANADGNYIRLALQSLAALQDLVGSEEARRAYQWLLVSSGAPHIDPGNFTVNPELNIVPRGMPRIPARAPRCVPGAGKRS